MFGQAFRTLASSINVSGIEELLHVLLRRALIGMHTLIPDVENPEGWIDRIYRRRQEFHVDLERYNRAITEPDPAKVQTYIAEDGFYDRSESIISTARRLQHGELVSYDEIVVALEAPAESHYGQALAIGMRYLKAASDFFVGDLDRETLEARLDIGKPGRDGQAV
jgi:hypothetical protein